MYRIVKDLAFTVFFCPLNFQTTAVLILVFNYLYSSKTSMWRSVKGFTKANELVLHRFKNYLLVTFYFSSVFLRDHLNFIIVNIR
jgi:uncharacterized protein YdeI (YjbR/CyaY-like superfamily)